MKIINITKDAIEFEGGHAITFEHDRDCCEVNYADFESITDLIEGMVFVHPLIFEEVKDAGFRFGNTGQMVFVPCYSLQNGYYSSCIDIYYDGRPVLANTCCNIIMS